MNTNFKRIIFWVTVVSITLIPYFLKLIDSSGDGNAYANSAVYFAFHGVTLKPLFSDILLERFRSTLLVTLPLTLSVKIFGLSYFSIYIYSFACLLGTNILLFHIVKSLYNIRTAYFSIILFVLLPLYNGYLNGMILADTYSIFYLSLNVFLIIKSMYSRNNYKIVYILFSGIITVISYYSRQWIPIISFSTFFIGLFTIGSDEELSKKLKYSIYYIAGLIAGVILFFLISFILTGDFLYIIKLNYGYSKSGYQNLFPEYKFFRDPLHVFRGLFNNTLAFYGIIFLLCLYYKYCTSIKLVKSDKFILSTSLFVYLLLEIFLRFNFGFWYLLPGHYSALIFFLIIIISTSIINNNIVDNNRKIIVAGFVSMAALLLISISFAIVNNKVLYDFNSFITKLPIPSSYHLNKIDKYIFALVVALGVYFAIIMKRQLNKYDQNLKIFRYVIIFAVFINFTISLIHSAKIISDRVLISNEITKISTELANENTGIIYYLDEKYDPIASLSFEFLLTYLIEKAKINKGMEEGIIRLKEYEVYKKKLENGDKQIKGYIIIDNKYIDKYTTRFNSLSINAIPLLVMNSYSLYNISN